MKVFRKKTGKSIVVSKIMPIFAASKSKCGLRTAGITSSLFYAHTYSIKGLTTPCRVYGNVPGGLAFGAMTARSVVSLLSKHYSYEHEELFCAREQNGAAVLLPAPGVGEIPQVDERLRAGALRLDGAAAGAPYGEQGSPGRCVGPVAVPRVGNQQSPHRCRSESHLHLSAVASGRERIHPHRAHRRTPSERAAAHYRLQGQCKHSLTKQTVL